MTLTLFCTKFCVVFWLVFVVLSNNCFAKQVPLKICYGDPEQAPMFIGGQGELPIIDPTVQLTLLAQLDDALPTVGFKFIKNQWRQCLQDLAVNKVDAVIASHKIERQVFAVYPVDNNNLPDPNYAFASFSHCVVGNERFHHDWQSRKVFQKRAFNLALPNGYDIGNITKDERFFINHTFTSQQALNDVKNDAADATVGVCKVGDFSLFDPQYKALRIAPVYPELNTVTGYFVFSYGFYEQQPQLSQQIWQTMTQINIEKQYAHFFNQHRVGKSYASVGQP